MAGFPCEVWLLKIEEQRKLSSDIPTQSFPSFSVLCDLTDFILR